MHQNDHNNYLIFLFIQLLGKYQVKDMKIYIEHVIDESLKLWNWVTMNDISRSIGQRRFQFHAMFVWIIHDSPRLTHFCGMLYCKGHIFLVSYSAYTLFLYA